MRGEAKFLTMFIFNYPNKFCFRVNINKKSKSFHFSSVLKFHYLFRIYKIIAIENGNKNHVNQLDLR